MGMDILIFEDASVGDLYPMTIGRPAMDITCGGRRLVWFASELAKKIGGRCLAHVRPHLAAMLEADHPDIVPFPKSKGTEPTLLLNARLVPSDAMMRSIEAMVKDAVPGIVRCEGSVAAALLPAGALDSVRTHDNIALATHFEALSIREFDRDLPLLAFPHDVIRHHLTILPEALTERIAQGDLREVSDGVFLAEGAKISDYVFTDTSDGPIVLEKNATIGSHSLLRGPLLIGENARVIEHSSLKDCTSIGHTTKIGGEVEASIIEPYTNKQHHGFLGHSYLGSWINLGAGTCNSDLKNTYGKVNMTYAGRKVNTDMQFIGAIIGDYAKTAINTGIFTGKMVGVCSMVYGFVTTNVPSFVNYARLFGQVTATPVEVMVATQGRMFARRNVTQRPCDIQLLHDMFELTLEERELDNIPLEPLSL